MWVNDIWLFLISREWFELRVMGTSSRRLSTYHHFSKQKFDVKVTKVSRTLMGYFCSLYGKTNKSLGTYTGHQIKSQVTYAVVKWTRKCQKISPFSFLLCRLFGNFGTNIPCSLDSTLDFCSKSFSFYFVWYLYVLGITLFWS